MAPSVRSDAASKGHGVAGFTKKAIFGAFVLCACIIVLFQHVRYTQLVIGIEPDQYSNSAVLDVENVMTLSKSENDTEQVLVDPSDPSDHQSMDWMVNSKVHNSASDIDVSIAVNNEEEIDREIEEELEPDWQNTDTSFSGLPNRSGIVSETNANSNVEDNEASSRVSQRESVDETGDMPLPLLNQVTEASKAVELRETSTTPASDNDWNIPRAVPKNWTPPKKCATAEEMGAETVGETRASSLRVRAMIREFIAEHGAERVRKLPGGEFCRRGFVLGQALEDGFGNNMYKVLTAAGLAVMLNRSLIIAERGGTNPTYVVRPKQRPRPAFGAYLEFSNQTFTVREVRRLWAVHDCAGKYNRHLILQTDSLEKGFRRTRCICDDWTSLTVPIFQFKGTSGPGAIQLLLKSSHPVMRAAAAKLLGNPAIPNSRPNTFGELFRAFIAPNADIEEAVQWALKGGPDPDITVHLRMLHSKSRLGTAAASTCITSIRQKISSELLSRGRRPRVVVVTDTPSIIPALRESLGQTVDVVRFNYMAYAKEIANRSKAFSLNSGLPARKRIRDWGEMPRWVAMVDFFLAARARTAVVSGAYRRVSTTYAQLAAALANAYTLNELDTSRPVCAYYSSLQAPLLASGLASQSGWGHTWRPFGGKLGCRNQERQCARTALLPYTWWDAPWQSPVSSDIRKLQGLAGIDDNGQVSESTMDKFCAAARRKPLLKVKLQIPSYEQAIAET